MTNKNKASSKKAGCNTASNRRVRKPKINATSLPLVNRSAWSPAIAQLHAAMLLLHVLMHMGRDLSDWFALL